jgi:DNA-directed RNA polymerase specialized sigma subunit
MAETGRVLGVSESRVSQLHRQLTIRLREALDGDRALFAGPREA